MVFKPRLLFALEKDDVVRLLAFFHPLEIKVARRFAFAENLAHRRAAPEGVGIIQLVAVAIRLVERQLKRVAVLLCQQLVIHRLARHRHGRRRHGGGLRHLVSIRHGFQLFQPGRVVALFRVAEMAKQPQSGGQRHGAHRQHQHDRKHERRGNFSFHNRFLSLHNAVKHLRLLALRDVQAGEMGVQTVFDVFIPIHALLLLPARREAVHTPFSVSC